jgi:formamidopyrimidine-DNA glycosylase
MPELPDITVYVERLAARVEGARLERVELRSPFVLRTVEPPVGALEGRVVAGVRRQGKRILLDFEGGLHLVLHLMIAGRLRWRGPGRGATGTNVLATLGWPHGALVFTEAAKRKRASLHVVRSEDLAAFDRGGLEVGESSREVFAARLRAENHTQKRALTDPRILSGIGNAYSDEILFDAGLSPFRLTAQLDEDALDRLYRSCRRVLGEWTERLRAEVGEGFPERVTAFRPGMAVHGRYREPCPACGSPVQRIVYAENEANYCARCQTGGRLLADRALSRLLKRNWPGTLDELEGVERAPAPGGISASGGPRRKGTRPRRGSRGR